MADSLTGVWDGTYIQPASGIVTFLATLIESGGALGGDVTEPCVTARLPVKHPQRFDCGSSIRQRGLVRQALRAAWLRL